MESISKKIILILLLVLPLKVLATGNISISTPSLSIEVGSSKTFTITAINTIGDVSISSSNTGVATVSSNEWSTGMVGDGETKSGIITVTGNNIGSTTIILTIDAATFDSEDLSGQTRTITVNVIDKSASKPESNETPSSKQEPNVPLPSKPVQNTNNTSSTNNNLKELTVDGHELTKIDNKNYSLVVSNDINSINIKATAEDSKSKISGIGNHDINIGENNIEIIVIAENGSENKINIKVTRKDDYYLEDLDLILKNDKIEDKNITIKNDDKITKEDLEKIRKSRKIVKFNYYDENKNLLYSWIIDGTKLKDAKDLLTTISNDSKNKKEIFKLSNYADGLIINFSQTNNLFSGLRVKLFVGNKYEDNNLINIYYYDKDNNKLDLISKELKVKDGYIEFEVINGTDYFATMSTISNFVEIATPKEKTTNILLIALIAIIILISTILVIFIIKRKKSNNKNIKKEDNNISTNNYNYLNDNDLNMNNSYDDSNNNSFNINNNYNSDNNNFFKG